MHIIALFPAIPCMEMAGSYRMESISTSNVSLHQNFNANDVEIMVNEPFFLFSSAANRMG